MGRKGLTVGTVTAGENGRFSTVIQPDSSKTSETLELKATAPRGASTQAWATSDPNGPDLHNPGDLPALSDRARIWLPSAFRNG